MLSNAYFLAKFRFDTAENDPAKNLQNFANFANFADPNPLTDPIAQVPDRMQPAHPHAVLRLPGREPRRLRARRRGAAGAELGQQADLLVLQRVLQGVESENTI